MTAVNSSAAHKLASVLLHNADQATVPTLLLHYLRSLLPFTSPSPSPPLPSLSTILLLPSPINYCESDYAVSSDIAEFYNTLSNLSFVLAALYAFSQCRRFRLPLRFHCIALFILMTGLGSAVYHATLTWSALKADELSENLLFISLIHMQRPAAATLLHALCASFGILFVHWLLFCEIHILSVSIVAIRHYWTASAAVQSVRAAFVRGLVLSLMGEACWLADHLLCRYGGEWWQLHGWWHLLMGACIHQLFVVAVVLYSPNGRLQRERENGKVNGSQQQHQPLLNGSAARDKQATEKATEKEVNGVAVVRRYGLDWLQAVPADSKRVR